MPATTRHREDRCHAEHDGESVVGPVSSEEGDDRGGGSVVADEDIGGHRHEEQREVGDREAEQPHGPGRARRGQRGIAVRGARCANAIALARSERPSSPRPRKTVAAERDGVREDPQRRAAQRRTTGSIGTWAAS